MKFMKKFVSVLLILAFIVGSFAGCSSGKEAASNSNGTDDGNSEASSNESPDDGAGDKEQEQKYKIVVFTLKSSGQLNDAFEAFLGSISEELGFEYSVRYKGDDGSELLSKIQTAISEGYQGIITMKDEGNTNEIVALCEENGVYYGNIWNNQGSSLNASSGGYAFLNSPYFVGGMTDCEDDMATEAAAYCDAVAKAYAALPEDQKEGSIGFVTMPPAWQPNQVTAVEGMYQKLKASEAEGGYGIPDSAFAVNGLEKRQEEERFAGKPVPAGSYIWPSMDVTSKKLESKYFDTNPNMQLLISTLAYSFINPALDSANKLSSMRVWVTGFDNEPALINNFGTKGNQTYQGSRTAPVESLAMPLVQILDKLAGYSYPDKEEAMAEFAEITDENKMKLKNTQLKYSSTMVITSDEEMDAYLNHNVYGSAKGEDSLVDAATLKELMVTYNSGATYEKLVETFSNNSTLVTMEKVLENANK